MQMHAGEHQQSYLSGGEASPSLPLSHLYSSSSAQDFSQHQQLLDDTPLTMLDDSDLHELLGETLPLLSATGQQQQGEEDTGYLCHHQQQPMFKQEHPHPHPQQQQQTPYLPTETSSNHHHAQSHSAYTENAHTAEPQPAHDPGLAYTQRIPNHEGNRHVHSVQYPSVNSPSHLPESCVPLDILTMTLRGNHLYQQFFPVQELLHEAAKQLGGGGGVGVQTAADAGNTSTPSTAVHTDVHTLALLLLAAICTAINRETQTHQSHHDAHTHMLPNQHYTYSSNKTDTGYNDQQSHSHSQSQPQSQSQSGVVQFQHHSSRSRSKSRQRQGEETQDTETQNNRHPPRHRHRHRRRSAAPATDTRSHLVYTEAGVWVQRATSNNASRLNEEVVSGMGSLSFDDDESHYNRQERQQQTGPTIAAVATVVSRGRRALAAYPVPSPHHHSSSLHGATTGQGRSRSLSLHRHPARHRSTSTGKRKREGGEMEMDMGIGRNTQRDEPEQSSHYHHNPNPNDDGYSSLCSCSDCEDDEVLSADESGENSMAEEDERMVEKEEEGQQHPHLHPHSSIPSYPQYHPGSSSPAHLVSSSSSVANNWKRRPGRPNKQVSSGSPSSSVSRPRPRTQYQPLTSREMEMRMTVKQQLLKFSFTQSDLAKLAGVSKASVCTWLQGPTSPAMHNKIWAAATAWMQQMRDKEREAASSETMTNGTKKENIDLAQQQAAAPMSTTALTSLDPLLVPPLPSLLPL